MTSWSRLVSIGEPESSEFSGRKLSAMTVRFSFIPTRSPKYNILFSAFTTMAMLLRTGGMMVKSVEWIIRNLVDEVRC